MNDAWGYDDSAQTEPEHNDGPKALRDAYKRQGEILEQIQKQLADERAERSREKVSSVFSELGVPGAAELYQGEPDPEKARAWAESMRAAFGSGATQSQTTGAVPPAPALDEQTQQQFQQMTEAGQSGTPLGNFESAQAAVGQASDLSALIAAMNQANHLNG